MTYYENFRSNGPARSGGYHGGTDRLRATVLHLSVLLALVHPMGGLVGPLAIMVTMGEKHREIEGEAIEAFNFGITLSTVSLVFLAFQDVFDFTSELSGLLYTVYAFTVVGMVAWAIRRVRAGGNHDYPLRIDLLVTPPPGSRGATLHRDVEALKKRRRRKH